MIMKSLLIAAMIAIGGIATVGVPAQAASFVVQTDNGWHHGRRHHEDRRHWRRHHERHCWVQERRSWHHGHRVIRRERVCD
jgi:Ni/Co efflux regulator RcnB